MMKIEGRRWYGWQQLGPGGIEAPWRITPILVENITPLKTGAGWLHLDVIMLLRPFQPRRLRVRLQVISRRADTLIASWQAPGESISLVAVNTIDRGWIEQHCEWIVSTHPWQALVGNDDETLSFSTGGEGASAEAYLSSLFGDGADEILGGAALSGTRWPCHEESPARTGVTPVNWKCEGMPAFLLLKGKVPKQQEEKWFIYHEGGRVIFRRSWTGIRIWEADVRVTQNAVEVTALTVNLDQAQYGYGSPAVEIERFDRCVKNVIWAREAWGYEPEPEEPCKAAAAWQAIQMAGA